MPTRVYIPTEPYTPTGESMYAQPAPDNALTAPPEQQSALSRGINRLLGTQFGEERYQTWPEKMIRSAATLAGDVVSGAVPVLPPGSRREDFTDEPAPGVDSNAPWWKISRWVPPVAAQPNDVMMERAQDLAGVAMGGGIGGTGKAAAAGEAVLGSGPVRKMRYDALPDDMQTLLHDYMGERTVPELPVSTIKVADIPEMKMPTRERGPEHAMRMDLNETPPVVTAHGEFLDGRHRTYAARQRGVEELPVIDLSAHMTPEMARKESMGKVLRSDSQAGTGIQAVKNAPAWYSAVEHALEQSTTGSAPGAQWLATLRNSRGVKPEEMSWLGLDDYLAAAQVEGRKVTRAELQDYVRSHAVELRDVEKGIDGKPGWAELGPREQRKVRENFELLEGGPPPSELELKNWYQELNSGDLETMGLSRPPSVRYSDYQLPGGENYREHLITMPSKNPHSPLSGDEFGELAAYREQRGRDRALSPEQTAREEALIARNKAWRDNDPTPYKSSHWDEPNILAHVRTNDRVMQVPFTAEETAAIKAHEAVSTKLEALRKQQGEVGKEIAAAAKPLEAARRAEIFAENKAGRFSNAETMRKLEEPAEHPQLAPLQEKLAALRAQESELRSSLPEKPEPRQVKSLHLEEVQSDWHQQGRDKGYRPPNSGEAAKAAEAAEADALRKAWLEVSNGHIENYNQGAGMGLQRDYFNDLQNRVANHPAVREAREEKLRAQAADREGIPDAPFKKTWHELALKRMLRRAAEEGYERLSWTPGEAQAARYSLDKSLKNVQYQRDPDGTYQLYGETTAGGHHKFGENIPKDKLSDYVGKELAHKIADDKNSVGKLEGVDLKVGGEGMRGFYDQILPKALEKIGREHGVKVQRSKLGEPLRIEEASEASGGGWNVYSKDGSDVHYFENKTKAEEFANKETPAIFYIDIPQSLRDAALRRGFPLFSGGKMFVPHQEEDK